VLYDDGEVEVLNLVREKWHIIEDDSVADEVGLYLYLLHHNLSLSKLLTIISVDRKKEVIMAVLMLPLKCMCCIILAFSS
jgi:hypothetical protein